MWPKTAPIPDVKNTISASKKPLNTAGGWASHFSLYSRGKTLEFKQKHPEKTNDIRSDSSLQALLKRFLTYRYSSSPVPLTSWSNSALIGLTLKTTRLTAESIKKRSIGPTEIDDK